MPTERSRPCLFCPSCNRRLWELDLAGGFHARAHGPNLCTRWTSTTPSTWLTQAVQVRVALPARGHPPSSLSPSRAQRSLLEAFPIDSDHRTTSPVLTRSIPVQPRQQIRFPKFDPDPPCLPTPGRRCLILTGNVLRAGCRRLSTAHAHRAGPTTTFYESQLARRTAGKEGIPQGCLGSPSALENRTFTAQNLDMFAQTGVAWVPLCTRCKVGPCEVDFWGLMFP